MFRSSTIIGELALNLAKVIFMLKHLVKLHRYMSSDAVAACCHSSLTNKYTFINLKNTLKFALKYT